MKRLYMFAWLRIMLLLIDLVQLPNWMPYRLHFVWAHYGWGDLWWWTTHRGWALCPDEDVW